MTTLALLVSLAIGASLGALLATLGRARALEWVVHRALRSVDTIPWALHHPDSFSRFLEVTTPVGTALGPRASGRMLASIKAAYPEQLDVYGDPDLDEAGIAGYLARTGLLQDFDVGESDVRDALAAVDIDARCLEPRSSAVEYHPRTAPAGGQSLVSEVDPLAGALLTWPVAFPSRWRDHAEFVRHVTLGGIALVAVPSAAWQRAVQLYLERLAAPLDDVRFVRVPADDLWVRDYGPTFVASSGGQLSIIANPYVPAECPFQKADDQFAIELGRIFGLPVHRLPLFVEGGNVVGDGRGTVIMCDSVLARNPEVSPGRLEALVEAWLGCRQLVLLPSLEGEVTGHADMMVKFLDAETIAVAQAPSRYRWSRIFDDVVERLSTTRPCGGSAPYRVVRVPVVPFGALDHRVWGYVNALTVNRTVILPRYGLSTDALAEKAYREVLPSHEVVSVDMRAYPTGAVHCQAKELPAALMDRLVGA